VSFRYFKQSVRKPVNAQMQLSIAGDPTKPAVLILGGISATCNPVTPTGEGWWQGLSTALPALEDCCLISCDYLGGLGQSERDDSPCLSTEGLSIEQQSEAIAEALLGSGISHLHAIIGGSYGGQVALPLASASALQVQKLVLIAAAHRPHAAAVTLRKFQREFIQLAARADEPNLGIELARALAMFTYRSATALDQFHPQPEHAYQYLRSRAKHLVEQQPERARSLFDNFGPALDAFQFAPQRLHCPTLVIGFQSDFLVPPDLVQNFAELIPDCAGLHLFDSSYGHDGFIKDTHLYAKIVKRFVTDA